MSKTEKEATMRAVDTGEVFKVKSVRRSQERNTTVFFNLDSEGEVDGLRVNMVSVTLKERSSGEPLPPIGESNGGSHATRWISIKLLGKEAYNGKSVSQTYTIPYNAKGLSGRKVPSILDLPENFLNQVEEVTGLPLWEVIEETCYNYGVSLEHS